MEFEKVVKVLAEYKECDPGIIKMETSFEDLELDSLDVVELVMNLEQEFDISLELNESIKSVKDLVDLIKAQTK